MMKRESYFDNAKAILIFLVVFAHFIEPVISQNWFLNTLFLFIYLFHMPAFIFISGYFSNNRTEKGWIKKIIDKFLIPYIVIQLLFVLFTKLIGLSNYGFTLFTPAYIYWYLFAMFAWNIGLRIIKLLQIEVKYSIILSIILSLFVGYLNFVSWKLSLSRIIVFFPFFLLGYYFKTNSIKPKDIIKNKVVALLIMIIAAAIIIFSNQSINGNWLFCASSYAGLGASGIEGLIIRTVIYIVQFSMMFAFFRLVTRRENKFTYVGSRTLSIYIVHGFIVKLLVSTSFYEEVNMLSMFLMFIFSCVTVSILSLLPQSIIRKK